MLLKKNCCPKLQKIHYWNTFQNLNLEKKEHLPSSRQQDILGLVSDFRTMFPDVPGKTTAALYDVEVGDARPIKKTPPEPNQAPASQKGD